MLETGRGGHGFGDGKGRRGKAEEKQDLGVRAAPQPHVNLGTARPSAGFPGQPPVAAVATRSLAGEKLRICHGRVGGAAPGP